MAKHNLWVLGTNYRGTVTKREPGWIYFTDESGKGFIYPDWMCHMSDIPDMTFGNR